MLPTPSTSHVDFERIYEPAEDSYLLLDTLSSESEKVFLQRRFGGDGIADVSPSPIVVEIGTGSGVVLAFVNAHASIIFNRTEVLTLGVDVNIRACEATQETIRIAAQEQTNPAHYIGNVVGDLSTPLRAGLVDVLIFNPPYVPTAELPELPASESRDSVRSSQFEDDSHLLALSYAGGADGMETTNRLLDMLPETLSGRGVAYILLCAQNKPEVVKAQIREWGEGWDVETVGSSGKKAGWEKLQIIRLWRSQT